ncbi:DUF3696 domain-containing protein [Undibacterium sp. FT147W]|uniref:DUF3696 domain-containing protein n=1 Tax=Undibacterium rivi TaxID=2828729 RepID=A0ABS5GZZ1_9BURK|nr:DUF3696 domain-containing protein [Undibacterium rivi]MBR7791687.1 DUF3696 domain-containing protein [Undibacterium rivi]
MFKILSATNYRSFKDLEIELAPITLFVGPNNSGKSSIVSILRLLSQTADSNDPNVRLLLNGPLGDFGTYKDLIHENEIRRNLDVSITVLNNRLHPQVASGKEIAFKLKYKYRSAIKEIILKRIECFANNKHRVTAELNEDSEKFLIRKIADETISPSLNGSRIFRGFNIKNFLPRMLGASYMNDDDRLGVLFAKEMLQVQRDAFVTNKYLQSIEYVGAMRMPPSRTYLYTGERRRKVGANGEHALSMLVMDSMRRGSKTKGILQHVIGWLSRAGIASDIKVVSLSDRYFEIHIQHPITKEYENFADVGYGNSQVIPILVAGLNCDSEDTLIVEEPEIHLHPKAQAELGDFFIELNNKGVQSIVETHSEHMILRLQKRIAERVLNPKDIYIYYVNPTPNGKEIIRLEMDSKGMFKQDWPGGFFPERLNEARDLAIARSTSNTVEKASPLDKFNVSVEKEKSVISRTRKILK